MIKKETKSVLEAFEKSVEAGFGFVNYKGKSYMMALKEIQSKEETLKKIDEVSDKLLKEFGGKN